MGLASAAKWKTKSTGSPSSRCSVMSWLRKTKSSLRISSMFVSVLTTRLSTAITRWPCPSRYSQRWLPRKPVPPVTTEVGIRRRSLVTGYVGAVNSEQPRDLGKLTRQVGAFGELAGAALDPDRAGQTGRERAGDVVLDVVADHGDLGGLKPEHGDCALVGLRVRLAR